MEASARFKWPFSIKRGLRDLPVEHATHRRALPATNQAQRVERLYDCFRAILFWPLKGDVYLTRAEEGACLFRAQASLLHGRRLVWTSPT